MTVPKGIEVVDQRLVAHGFTAADGVVLEGKVTDLATGQPIAATMRLQRVEPQEKGGYLYPVVAEAKADAQGHWVLKKAPAGWVRVVVEADGFVPRVAGYARFDEQPRWQSYDCGLSRPAPVSGRITDEAGKPLADVDVRLDNVQPESGGRYESPLEYTVKTDAEGRFRAEQVPVGKATIWVHKPGYCRPGLGLPITTPKDDVELQMMKSASVRVTVDFTGKERPDGYMVKIEPEGGEAVGTYGGSGNIDAKNQMTFENVPPGRYVLRGQPNPGSGDRGDRAGHRGPEGRSGVRGHAEGEVSGGGLIPAPPPVPAPPVRGRRWRQGQLRTPAVASPTSSLDPTRGHPHHPPRQPRSAERRQPRVPHPG